MEQEVLSTPGSQMKRGVSNWSLSEIKLETTGLERNPYQLDFVFYNNIVQYKCSCDHFRGLTLLYFCRHCVALRCKSCVVHEVDSQYCQHCLEYIPTIDQKFQLNKCASCYQCPSCQHLLFNSVNSSQTSSSDAQDEIVKRTYQLACEFCKWSSEVYTMEGSRISSNLADIELQNIDKIQELKSFYKATSQKEKADKMKKRFHSRSGNTMDLLKKYGIDNTLSPKLFESLRARTNFNDKSASTNKYNLEPKTNEELAIEAFKPTKSREPEELEKLDTEFYYRKDFNLNEISGIDQRLAQLEIQPELVKDFKPISKSLSVKRSQRCKECERNLCRGEYSPVSIKFKIQSSAYYHVPELKLRNDKYPMTLKLGEYNIVEFSIQNQTLSKVKTKLTNLPEENDVLCDLVLPSVEMVLNQKDDTIDYEHVPLNIRPLNEETQVTFQSLSKIGFYIKVRPKIKTDSLSIMFLLSHDVAVLQNQREGERAEKISYVVKVTLGRVE